MTAQLQPQPPSTPFERDAATDNRRRIMRYFAALLSGITAVIYLLIGFQVVIVMSNLTGSPMDQVFGIFAGIAYAFGTYLLLTRDNRLYWIVGAVLQVFVISMYFRIAPQRVPQYEFWGLMLRVPQLALLFSLSYLAWRTPADASPDSPR